jgi:hypothetical protein
MQVLGGELAWCAETDRHCRKILAAHFEGVPNLGDITAVDWADVPPVDIVTAGWPCQDLSLAGLDVAANLKVKEMRISEAERFVICYNPEAAERDARVRERMLAQLDEMITGSDKLSKTRRAELRGVISTKPGLNRYLRVTPGGLLRTDAAAAGELDLAHPRHLHRPRRHLQADRRAH